MQPHNPPRPPSERNCRIYERHVLGGETQEAVAADYHITRQRVAQVAALVEGWIAGHPEHPLAQTMRVRLTRRWESLWSETMAGFERSRRDREVVTQRSLRLASAGPDDALTLLTERTVRQSPGDVRFLNVGLRVTDRQQRLWPRVAVERPAQVADSSAGEGDLGNRVRAGE